jgi:hypothetical protein
MTDKETLAQILERLAKIEQLLSTINLRLAAMTNWKTSEA